MPPPLHSHQLASPQPPSLCALSCQVAYKQRGGNPLKHGFFFCMGLLSAVLSLTWLLHIVLYIFVDPPADQFLNKLFMDLDGFFALFGVATYHRPHPLPSPHPHPTPTLTLTLATRRAPPHQPPRQP